MNVSITVTGLVTVGEGEMERVESRRFALPYPPFEGLFVRLSVGPEDVWFRVARVAYVYPEGTLVRLEPHNLDLDMRLLAKMFAEIGRPEWSYGNLLPANLPL